MYTDVADPWKQYVVSCHACMLHAQLFNLHTKTMKLAEETFVITVFVLWAFIHAQFRILYSSTFRHRSVPDFSNDQLKSL